MPSVAELVALQRDALSALARVRAVLTQSGRARSNARQLANTTSARHLAAAEALSQTIGVATSSLAKNPRHREKLIAKQLEAKAKIGYSGRDVDQLASEFKAGTPDILRLARERKSSSRMNEWLGGAAAAAEEMSLAASRVQSKANADDSAASERMRQEAADGSRQVQAALAAWTEAAVKAGPTALPSWPTDTWARWVAPTSVRPVYVGNFALPAAPEQLDQAHEPTDQIPLVVSPNTGSGFVVMHRAAERDDAVSAARGLLLRLLAAIPPGKLRLTIFDPLGLGESVAPILALNDHDPRLLDGKVHSSQQALRERLDDLTSHIELVIQKYLRGEYATIEEYNAAAGDIAEPYRYFVVFDYPNQFDEECVERLQRIIENGPRCGVFPLIVASDSMPATRFGTPVALPSGPTYLTLGGECSAVTASGEQLKGILRVPLDPLGRHGREAGQAIFDRVVEQVGREGRGADNVTVNLRRSLTLHGTAVRAGVRPDLAPSGTEADLDDESTWWRGSTKDHVGAPIGQSGARDIALLRFDSQILSGGLLVGRPGSGKSTLLHTWLAALCTLYSPEELELHLIDFREGVEFKAYAENGLPHAKCVAVESEREFGLSVLQSLVAELRDRAAVVRTTGGEQTTFANVRDAVSRPLPRIVLVFDEFHVLFSEADSIGVQAGDLLETLIRQGRGFGIHVLLGSQSIAGLDALGRHVLQLLPVRILLPSSEQDAHTLLGDRNDAWRMLTRRGEGILNPSGGAVEANVPFQAAYETDADRLSRLRRLRAKADAAGFRRRPVVFEGHEAAELGVESASALVTAATSNPLSVQLRVGLPMTLDGPLDVGLRREAGAHALVVAPEPSGIGPAVLAAGLASLLARPDATVHLVDLMPVGEGLADALPALTGSAAVTVTGRRGMTDVFAKVAQLVKQRSDEEDRRASPVALVVNGLGRARDLDPMGSDSSGDGPDPLESLRTVLMDGPEVGVHVVAWADSLSTLQRRLPRSLINEFGVRVVASCGRDASLELLDDESAAQLKPNQVRVADEMSGLSVKARCHQLPSAALLTRLLEASR